MAAGDAFKAFTFAFLLLGTLPTGGRSAKCPNKCDGTPARRGGTECELSIPGDVKAGSICVWEVVNTTGLLTFVLDSDLKLDAAGDALTVVTTPDNGTIGVPELVDLVDRYGVVFTNVSDIKEERPVTVRLTISGVTKPRVFGLRYTNTDFTLPVKEHQTYHIPLTNVTTAAADKRKERGASPKIPSVKITLSPKGGSADELAVVEVEQVDGKPQVSYTGAATPDPGFDVLAADPVKPIVASFKDFDPTTDRLTFTVDMVDQFCSRYTTDASSSFLIDGSKRTAGQSINCLHLLESKSPVRLDYTKLVNLLGPSDLLTIQSGGTEFSSPIVALFNDQNVGEVKDQMRSQFSNSTRMRISYVSHYVSRLTESPAISFAPAPLSKVVTLTNDTADVTLQADGSEKDPLFLIQVPSTTRARIGLKRTDPIDATLSFYSSDLVSESRPFLTLSPKTWLPDAVLSPTNVLRIGVTGGRGRVDGTVAAEATGGTDATAIGDTDSVTFRSGDLPAGGQATWLIPARPSANGSLTLRISQLTLEGDGACLRVTKLDGNRRELVSECWKSDMLSSSNLNVVLPDMVLSPSATYLVRYVRSSKSGTSATSPVPVLMSASFSYSPVNGCSFDRNLAAGTRLVLTPAGFPNPAPLVDPDLYSATAITDSCGWRVNGTSGSRLVHAVFHDLDLKGSQSLTIKYNGTSDKLTSANATIRLPDDLIVPETMMMELRTPLPQTTAASNLTSLTGRGFRVAVEDVPCGGLLLVDAGNTTTVTATLSTPSYPAAVTASRCMWVVRTGSSPGQGKVFNITRTFGAGDQKDGQLTIFDDGNTHDAGHVRQVNLTVNGTWSVLSSVPAVVVQYSLKPGSKSAPGLRLSFAPLDCALLWNGTAKVCGNREDRCILPAWNCDGHNDCGDNSDEIHCNMTMPVPPPPSPSPAPGGDSSSSGVSGWVIVLLIIPMSIGVGVLLTLFGPMLLTRMRGSRYSEFRNFVAEDT